MHKVFVTDTVLPALVPDMTYDGMAVADGRAAGLAWESLVHGSLDQVERDKVKKALLGYCAQDTLAMVRLVERLKASGRRADNTDRNHDRDSFGFRA